MAQHMQQGPPTTIDARLTELESQVAALKRQAERGSDEGWLKRVIGSTKDMPDFGEVVRYGQEARQAQPPPDDVPA